MKTKKPPIEAARSDKKKVRGGEKEIGGGKQERNREKIGSDLYGQGPKSLHSLRTKNKGGGSESTQQSRAFLKRCETNSTGSAADWKSSERGKKEDHR